MNKNIIWAWVIKNSIAILAWVVLAIVFGKWWIALFGIFFTSEVKTEEKAYRICDRCGEHSPIADTKKEALEKAKAAGWLHVEDENKDYCPDCINDVPKLKALKDNT